MTHPFDSPMTRRAMLRQLTVVAGAAAGLPLLGWSTAVRAETAGTASKSAVQYQDQPKGAAACENCANFVARKDAHAAGRCTIVTGDISPQGWCLAYAGKG